MLSHGVIFLFASATVDNRPQGRTECLANLFYRLQPQLDGPLKTHQNGDGNLKAL
jgi:hypothetical protein